MEYKLHDRLKNYLVLLMADINQSAKCHEIIQDYKEIV